MEASFNKALLRAVSPEAKAGRGFARIVGVAGSGPHTFRTLRTLVERVGLGRPKDSG